MATTVRKTARKTATKASRKATAKTTGKKAGASASASAKKSLTLPSLGDLRKLVGRLKLPGVDVAAIIESQRKDMEALAEANRQAYEGIKALAQRRNEILRAALVEWQETMKDVAGKDAMSKNAERAKAGVKKAIESFRELAEMEAESRRKAWKVLQDRFQENLANLQSLLLKSK
jgi:phasin family protein